MKTREAHKRSIMWLLVAGLLVRLILAYVLLPDSGHAGDRAWYSRWIAALLSVGPGEFYAKTVVNYPPGYMYVLWLVGGVSTAIASVFGIDAQKVIMELIKIPPILFDVAGGFLLYRIVKRWPGEGATSERMAFTATALYVFNPVMVYDSAVWGQTDAVGAFIMLLGIMALLCWSPEIAASVAVISALLKPQFGIVLMPLIGIVLLRRHLAGLSTSQTSPSISYWIRRHGPIRILTSMVVGAMVFYALVLPFRLNFHTFLDRMADTAGGYKILSLNAFNPWALIGTDKPSIAFGGVENYSSDEISLVGVLTGVMIGTALLGAGFILGAVRLFRRSDIRSVVLVGAYLSLCFFILPTRVHERYLVPVFAFLSILAVLDRRWMLATWVLMFGSLINLHAVLSNIGTENVARLPFGEFARSPSGILISITIQSAVFVFSAWMLVGKQFSFAEEETNIQRVS